METVGVYCESKLRTYGFKLVSDLSLLSWMVGPDQLTTCGIILQELGERGFRFRMVAARESGNAKIRIHLVLDRGKAAGATDQIRILLDPDLEANKTVCSLSPVEMIFFHGPHYGDRYGIADTVFSVLAQESIPVILSSCSGSSIYLVFPYNVAKVARTILSGSIEIPQKIGTDHKNPKEKCVHAST